MLATGTGESDWRLGLESLRKLGEFKSTYHYPCEQSPHFLLLAGMSLIKD